MNSSADKIDQIFWDALQIPDVEERRSYLDRACGGDLALRQLVEKLVQARPKAERFLEYPLVGEPATVDPPVAVGPARVIGRYKLLQQIGEGGMGTVYLAEQTQPVQRKVALKLIKPGMDSRQVIARFEAERQALAVMDHPNIAKVLDAGTTDEPDAAGSPRPYFVMELVRGVPITRYCDEHRLTPRQRLELFVPVCQAIQHAHQKGIIHRDVKPSNVLVALYDGRPVVKVIDFGVAKAAGQRLTDKSLFTEFGAVVGTLEYMSPEQAELNNQDIDTRSDIYSLGVLLYELLTGSTPLDRARLAKAAFVETLRIIREEDPPRPSTRLSESKDALPAISVRRNTEPARLTRLVRGELDWIVMKALEKDRARRYETANGIAMDVQRYLADEAVQACPPSAAYRLRKFVRRNKGSVLAASVVLLALVVGIIGATWGMLRAAAAEKAAIENRDKALVAEQAAKTDRDKAIAETYRALLSETRSLRLARTPGWRVEALQNLRRLAGLDTSLRDLVALRTEGVACLGEFDAREVSRLAGQPEGIWSLDFNSDGTTLAAAGYGFLQLWDIASGHPLREITDPLRILSLQGGMQAAFPAVRFQPEGTYFAHTTWDRRVGFLRWPPNDTPLPAVKANAQPRSLAFDRQGRMLAVSWAGGRVGVYDASTGAPKQEFQTGHSDYNLPVALHPDGTLLATLGPDYAVQVRGVPDDDKPLVFGKHAGTHVLSFSSDGRFLASASRNHTAKLWDVKKGQEFLPLLGHSARVNGVAFSPDASLVATVSDDQTARLWETRTGQTLMVLHPEAGPLLAVAFSPDGSRLAVAASAIIIYQLTDRRERRVLAGHSYAIPGLAFHPHKPLLASGSWDNQIITWDYLTGRPIGAPLRGQAGRNVGQIEFSPDGQLLAAGPVQGTTAVANAEYPIALWESNTGKLRRSLAGHGTGVVSLAFDSSGGLLASGALNGTARIWNVSTGDVVQHWSDAKGAVQAVHFLNGGAALITGDASGQVFIRDVKSGQTIGQAAVPGGVMRFAVVPGARSLVVASNEGAIRIFSLPDLKPLVAREQAHAGPIFALAVSPDGRFVATGGRDRQVILWDLQVLEKRFDFPAQTSPVLCLRFARDGTCLAVSGLEELITLWDLGRILPRLTGLGLASADARKED